MARLPKILEAKFEQVLLYADGPQVILLSSLSGSKIVAVAINDDDLEYPFFGAQVSSSFFMDYVNERFDLRYLLMRPDMKRNYVFDLAKMEDHIVPLKRATLSPENYEQYLPDAGVFSRDHTEKLSVKIGSKQTEQTFGVDGSWDLPEFSNFYSQVTDLYSFFNSIDVFLDDQASIDRKNRVRDAFVKPFEGGGSYVSLYDSLASVQSKDNRLHVAGISYNSPGHVKLMGFEKPFSEIKALLANLEANLPKIADEYNSLRGTLVQNKMLRMKSENFKPSKLQSEIISEKCVSLAKALDVVDYESMLVMAGNNMLVAAKVLLSIYRRATRLYEFFLQGRVSLDVPSSLK